MSSGGGAGRRGATGTAAPRRAQAQGFLFDDEDLFTGPDYEVPEHPAAGPDLERFGQERQSPRIPLVQDVKGGAAGYDVASEEGGLAVAKALARQTRTEGRTAEEYRTAVLGRLDALARVLEIAAQESIAELPALARVVLEPYIGKRGAVAIDGGPVINLSSSQTMPLGMILHELATNALKYGALSVPDGQVTLGWSADDGEGITRISLRWRESGGPKVVPPTATGFGTRMIQFAAQRDLEGGVEHSYEPDGFEATVTFPQR